MTVQTGLARLADEGSSIVRLGRVGLLVNATSVDTELRHAIELLHGRKDVQVTALFGPEHGVRGDAQDMIGVDAGTDSLTGLPVFSLYGHTEASLSPTPEMLEHIDTLVFDVQDIGSRYYTFVWTMVLAMRACAKAGKAFVVLDRPNPIGGVHVEGGAIEPGYESFVGLVSCPNRHGMTAGEIARWRHAVEKLDLELTVISMQGWERDMWFEHTGLPWVLPSPNMPTVDTALVYPGQCLIEGTNLSEGRGTEFPFEQTGAPWLRPADVIREMNALRLPGVRFDAVSIPVAPDGRRFPGQTIPGVRLAVTDRGSFRAVRTAMLLIDTIHRLYPNEFAWAGSNQREPGLRTVDRLAGTDRFRAAVDAGTLREILGEWDKQAESFRAMREPYLLYR
jgi:uncharacterized protein YbbC (DUF1343 family)